MQTATRTGSKNPTLLCRAAAIAATAGDKTKAKALFSEALKSNSCMDQTLKSESLRLSASL
jgi:hypothetical protein